MFVALAFAVGGLAFQRVCSEVVAEENAMGGLRRHH